VIPDGDPGLALVARHLEAAGGPPLAQYKDRCLRRRLAVRMRACGAASLSEYAARLAGSPEETRRLLDALTINVTQFFRNPEVWEQLEALLRPLVRRQQGRLHAWSAGCASGEEAYSLALLWDRLVREAGLTAPASGVVVEATDIDAASLERAAAGRYPSRAVSGTHRACAGLPGEGGEVAMPGAIRAQVHPRRHDLLRDPPPHPPYDLILCRNVIIYFEREAQERLLASFAEALPPGALLVLGRVESILGPARSAFELLHPRERIYRRAA